MARTMDTSMFWLACYVVWVGLPGAAVGGETPVEPAAVDTTPSSPDCDIEGVPFGGGSGDPDEPHLLCSPDHLNAVGEDATHLDDHFLVVADIDMEGVDDVEIIGDHEDRFTGQFNGNGFTIDNLAINTKYDEDVIQSGIFGTVGEGGVVANVTLSNVAMKADSMTGAVASVNRGLIEDVSVTADVITHSGGGCVASYNADTGVIRRVDADCNLYSGSHTAGGFVGTNSGTIVDAHISGTFDQHASHYTGGFVGMVGEEGIIKRSSSDVKLNMPGSSASAGGFVGINRGTITESYASGDVVARTHGVGGFVGQNDGNIANCYATGDVISFQSYVGGFVGQSGPVGPNSDSKPKITDSYSTGYVDGDDGVGGFAGHPRSAKTDGGFWDSTIAGVSNPVGMSDDARGITALETDEFGDERTFGWDFDDVWTIGEAPDGERRPVLQWQ